MIKIYKFRDNQFHPKDGDPRVIGERIDALKARHIGESEEFKEGFTTPEEVLKDALDPQSPLHSCGGFTWDQAEAARLHNLKEARDLMNCYEVIYEYDEPGREPIKISPANVRITDKEKRSIYVSPPDIMGKNEYKLQVIKDTQDIIARYVRRLKDLELITPELIRNYNGFIQELKRIEEEDVKGAKEAPKTPQKATKAAEKATKAPKKNGKAPVKV